MLAPKVAAGDVEARERIIEGNMPLVLSKVEDFIDSLPQYAFLRDDLVSAGFVGLVKAVKRMAEKGRGVKAPVEYICVVVANEIGALARQEGTIRIPPTAQKDAAAAGKPIKPMKAANELLPGLHADNIESAVDMFDLISSCCCTETERKYVEMRQAGYTLQEIADEVHTSLSAIYTTKEDLYRRVLKKAGLKHVKKGKK